MSQRFLVADHLTLEVVRAINLSEWEKGREYYFGPSRAWWRPDAEVLRGIANPTFDVKRLIAAVPACEPDLPPIARAWAFHMTINAGCHPWPNANHRTANLSFNFALMKAGLPKVGFPRPTQGQAMIEASHRQRDSDGGEYPLEDLLDASHRYRRLFEAFAKDLVFSHS